MTDSDDCTKEDNDDKKRDEGDCADEMWRNKINHEKTQGQQQITAYFKSKEKIEIEREVLEDMENPEGYETSDVVVDDEGRKRLILLGSDVVGLFPAMKDINTGRAVANQVRKSQIKMKGVKYREVARYCSGKRHLCGDLSEVENVLPWRNIAKDHSTNKTQYCNTIDSKQGS